MDVFVSGFVYINYLKSKITHPELLKYVQNDKGYSVNYEHIRSFYNDIGLDLSIYFNYFDIVSNEISKKYYEEIQKYKIIFLHTKGSNREINLDNIINLYKNDDNYIIICANSNVYDYTNEKYNIVKNYINIPIVNYIDVIKNAEIINVIDSCFSCIVYPLSITNKLKTKNVIIQNG